MQNLGIVRRRGGGKEDGKGSKFLGKRGGGEKRRSLNKSNHVLEITLSQFGLLWVNPLPPRGGRGGFRRFRFFRSRQLFIVSSSGLLRYLTYFKRGYSSGGGGAGVRSKGAITKKNPHNSPSVKDTRYVTLISSLFNSLNIFKDEYNFNRNYIFKEIPVFFQP